MGAKSKKAIRKRNKNFVWKYKWIKIPNCITNSPPIIIRKWVRIKIEHQESENDSLNKN